MSVTRAELDHLIRIAITAGDEIMAVYHEGGSTWEKDDATPLTEADLRADRVIRQGLEQEFPEAFILSEESTSTHLKNHERFFLVDPLDGTKEFLKRNGEFTVNIALIENGLPIAGVVFAPALNELFFGAHNIGAWKRDSLKTSLIGTTQVSDAGPLRVIGSRSHGTDKVDVWLGQLTRNYTFVEVGSSLKFCRIAEGQADIYPRFGPTSQWDTAAAQAILQEAGGMVADLNRNALRYGLNRPLLNSEFFALGNSSLLNLI